MSKINVQYGGDKLTQLQNILIAYTGKNLVGNAKDLDGSPRKWYTFMLEGKRNLAIENAVTNAGMKIKHEFTNGKSIYWIKVK